MTSANVGKRPQTSAKTAAFIVAAHALSEMSPAINDATASLFPPLEEVRRVSRQVAIAVAMEAQRTGLAAATGQEALEKGIDETMWQPRYVRYRRNRGR